MSGTVRLIAGQVSTFDIRTNVVPTVVPTLTIYSDAAETVVVVTLANTTATASPTTFRGTVPATVPVGDFYLGIGITTAFGTTVDRTCRLTMRPVGADVADSDDAVLAHQIRPSDQAATRRVLRGQSTAVTHTFIDEETTFDLDALPTLVVTDAEGNTVASPTVAHSGSAGSGTYTATLPSQSDLAALTLSWSGLRSSVPITMTDRIDIVGAYLFTLKQARESDTALVDPTKYSTAVLSAGRLAVEDEADYICGRSLVPRYARIKTDGTGTSDLRLPHSDLRAIRRVTVYTTTTASTDFTVDELAALALFEDGLVRRTDGTTWPGGTKNLVIVFEHGWDGPPADLTDAALLRLRTRLTRTRSPVLDRATSFTSDAGGTYRLDTAGELKTGIPEVDAVYARYSRRASTLGGTEQRRPAHAQLTYDPQIGGLYHGQIRRT